MKSKDQQPVAGKKQDLWFLFGIPLELFFSFFFNDPLSTNYSVLLNTERGWLLGLELVPFIVSLYYLLIQNCPFSIRREKWNLVSALPILLGILVMIIPYHDKTGDLVSGIHLFLAYAMLIVLNGILLRIVINDTVRLRRFLCLGVFILLLIMTLSAITGLAEVLYGIGIIHLLCSALQK